MESIANNWNKSDKIKNKKSGEIFIINDINPAFIYLATEKKPEKVVKIYNNNPKVKSQFELEFIWAMS